MSSGPLARRGLNATACGNCRHADTPLRAKQVEWERTRGLWGQPGKEDERYE